VRERESERAREQERERERERASEREQERESEREGSGVRMQGVGVASISSELFLPRSTARSKEGTVQGDLAYKKHSPPENHLGPKV